VTAEEAAPPQLPAKLRTRPLGKSGLVVSELALGTWGLSGEGYGPVSSDDADKTIIRARELGITLIDTADTYGARGGDPHAERMEKRLGRLLASDEGAIICTKGGNDLDASPARKRFDRDFLRLSAQRSADRLRRKPDLYLLHHPTVATLLRGEATSALEELQSEGVIRAWGVACGDAPVARAALERGASVVELPYNVFEQRALHEVTGELHEAKAGVLVRSTLAYGLLCGTWPADKTFPEGDHRRDRWTEAELRRRQADVAALRPLVKGDVHTIRAVALRYVLSNLLVSSAVVGVRTAAQLEANVRAIGDGPPYLSDADLAKIPAQT
jgi:aryl-alcohol dehydrogenase-like predicted oxidoreductase